jgi:antitoxin ParD1/3/4
MYFWRILEMEAAVAMNINLTPQLEELVRQKVASGLYTSASEVIREALRLLEEQDHMRAAKLDQLRRDIQDGLDSGPAAAWDAGKIKQEGVKRRADRAGGNRA